MYFLISTKNTKIGCDSLLIIFGRLSFPVHEVTTRLLTANQCR